MVNKKELNEAIRKVLFTQFKKQAKEAHKIVEEAGYKIWKCGGDWRVENEATGRTVYLEDGYRRTFIWHGPRYVNRSQYNDNFDFVGALNKPVNKEYYTSIAFTYMNESKAKQAYKRIQQHVSYVKMYERDIQDAQKKIAELQDKMVRYATYKAEEERKVKDIKKELGLA